MSDIQPGQTEWPHLLADLRVKREALDQVITTIETHFIRSAPFIEPAAPRPARKAKRTVARRAPKRIKSIDQRTDGRTEHEPRQRVARSLPDGDRATAILETLKRHDGTMRTGALAKAVKLTAYLLNKQLEVLGKSGHVDVSGTGYGKHVTLSRARAAKEAL